jgi:formylglycine-generating enzyme required for sulfatase activity
MHPSWDGGFLPSEAEWESAASGGSEQRAYPWGNAPPGMGNQYAIYGFDYPLDAGATTTGCYYPSSELCTGTSVVLSRRPAAPG